MDEIFIQVEGGRGCLKNVDVFVSAHLGQFVCLNKNPTERTRLPCDLEDSILDAPTRGEI